MLELQLHASLERRAGGFLSAAQFAASTEARRAADIVRSAGAVARERGLAGVEGYLAALDAVGPATSPGTREARAAIRAAIDDAFSSVSFDLWSGRSRPLS